MPRPPGSAARSTTPLTVPNPATRRRPAAALLEAVDSGRAPYLLLLLGNDASDWFRSALDALREDADAWEPVSCSTD
jgi:hypothetical protein